MKKILSIISLFLIFNLSYSIDVHLKFGTNLNIDNPIGDQDNIYQPSIGLEISQSADVFTLGVGAHLQDTAKVTVGPTQYSFGYTPAYGFLKLNLFPEVFKPYIIIKVGKIFIHPNAIPKESDFDPPKPWDDYQYFGGGIGIDIYDLQAELTVNYSDIEVHGYKDRFMHVNLSFGINLF